jgi:ribosomal protein L11 methyltransferase
MMEAASATVLAQLTVAAAMARALSDALAARFATGDAAVATFEGAGGDWIVEIHFAQPPEEAAVRDVVAQVAGESVANTFTFAAMHARDWVATSLAGLHPVAAGRFMIHGAHDRARVAPNRIGIEIEAALAFGTGHHGTTRGCLLALEAIIKGRRPRRVLDVGTGTGVLAIAAAKSLRRQVLASDIDQEAVIVAKANAHANRAGSLVEVVQSAGLSKRCFQSASFDLVLANILLGPLKSLATPMARILAPGAHVVLSGLLPQQANAALFAYRAHGLALERRIALDGWMTLVLRRPGLVSAGASLP